MATPIRASSHLDPDEIKAAVTIMPEAITEDFVRVPSDLAYYNAIYSDAIDMLLTAKRKVEECEAELRREYRASADVKVTESYLDSCVALDPRYKILRESVDRAEVNKSRANGVVDAIRAKKEMLISLGAHIRAEMNGQPSINERNDR